MANVQKLISDAQKNSSMLENVSKNHIIEESELEKSYLKEDLAEAVESYNELQKIVDAFDNFGWRPISEEDSEEIPLKAVKDMASVSRALVAGNTFVKRGVNVRVGYIWGRGVQFDKVNTSKARMDQFHSKLFTQQAYEERERTLATDGNAFHLISRPDIEDDLQSCVRIPLTEIVGIVTNPNDKEDIWYYKRQWTTSTIRATNGLARDEDKTLYYPSSHYYQSVQKYGGRQHKRISDISVDWDHVIFHEAVNKQVGWVWGIPDVAAVAHWARTYRDYLVNNAELVEAYNRIAWQAKGQSAAGLQRAAARIRQTPTRDPLTGNVRNIGGTAIQGVGSDLSAAPATGSTVDFTKGLPLASAVAAGLDVPLPALTSDPGNSNRSAAESLDLPTTKIMTTRQELWKDHFKQLFDFWGSNDAIITFPPINADTTKDRIQSLILARTGVTTDEGTQPFLYDEEVRKEMLDVLGIAPYKKWNQLPDLIAPEEEPTDVEDTTQTAPNGVPAQGVTGDVGVMTDGNQARANRTEDEDTK